MSRLRIGVLVSGGGSNLQAILDAASDPSCGFLVSAVISNVEGVRALVRARTSRVRSMHTCWQRASS